MIRPLQTYRAVSIAAFSLLVVAFILLLLVGISLTIIKPIYLVLFQSTSHVSPPTSIATELRFGVWGVCASGALSHDDGLCFGPKLGYTVPPDIRALIGIPDGVVDAIEKALLLILILHPIAACLAFITFIASLFLHYRPFAIFTLILAIITAILSSVVFGVDLGLVIVARNEVSKLAEFKFDVEFGNGVWMVLVAVILTWAAVVCLSARACYCCGVRRKKKVEVERY